MGSRDKMVDLFDARASPYTKVRERERECVCVRERKRECLCV